ncbi:hypothetical protein PCIT_a2546 [Pseudoalteromonas citrea]|uniref:IraD/Gp25-like domain-containing protein n=2 Tax=Pseudoalteromonas citrea TaxID=43655 RepID=A0AAD4AHH4_9GAMM|nr:type VI secretion system baseplate subunit TssE [Pseudoalteromonas citrea]KAF7769670.1 hypothetical protein PCIT_a2546 [Pseudoalteromonas citrea]
MALFDFLSQPARRQVRLDPIEYEAKSVVHHLTQLLNARRGVLKHLSDYGLPDVEDIYEGLPYSQHELANEVKQLIEKYEPRVTSALVIPVDIKEENCVIRFDITAYLKNGNTIHLNTRFASGGKANINTMKKR